MEMREQVEAVQRMQEYIEAHLQENISPAGLSRASLFSPWHSYRLFIKYIGITPADYIRKLRLSRSALHLRDSGGTIAEAAFAAGFGSVDGYQRAFRREFGCNPGEYAANPVPIYLFTPYGVQYRYCERRTDMESVKTVYIRETDRPARKVILKRGREAADYGTYCEEVGCDVWGLLQSVQSLGGEPVCLWLPQRYRKPGTSEYVQGAEVEPTYDGPVPEGFDVIELPAARYLMFQGEPFDEKDYCQAIEEVQRAISKYDPALAGQEWDPENPRIQLEPIGTRGYIELVPIR